MEAPARWQQVGGNAAEAYERHLVPAVFAPWAPQLIDLAKVSPGERVLDVACGTGVVARLAATRVGSSGSVVGLDVNAAMLAVAASLPQAAGTPVRWLEASALAMPLPDASFDVVLCQQGLQQFPDCAAALGEIKRVLVPGGRLAASVWAPIEGSPGMAALVRALERHVGLAAADNRRAPFSLADAERLRGLLETGGFHQVRVLTAVENARFASPEALVAAQLAATPLSTLGSISDNARAAVVRDVTEALAAFWQEGSFAVPMTAYIALASR